MYSLNMETQYVILGFLELEPNYGYDLKKLYDKFFAKKKPILSGQIYSTLARLKRDGKVEEASNPESNNPHSLEANSSLAVDQSDYIKKTKSGGPDRIKYQITDRGIVEFNQWLLEPEAPSETLQTALYIKTVLSILRGSDTKDFLFRQRHAHIDRMRELTKLRQNANLPNKLLIDHAIFHIEADLKWIDLTESRLLNFRKEIKNEFN